MTSLLDKMEKQEMCLWMYPEGIRSHSDEMLPFRHGAFRLAVERGLPISPVVISSFKSIFQRFKSFRGGTVTVKFLEPISTEGLTRDDTKELVKRVHAIMSKELELINK
jgi:1-acyl-sn-glycerol-3-phosphate acyltransferase